MGKHDPPNDDPDRPRLNDRTPNVKDDLRGQVSKTLGNRAALITGDAVAIFPHSGLEALDHGDCTRIGESLVQLLACAVQDGSVNSRGLLIANLHTAVVERDVTMEQLFTFAYLTERTALDELALDESIGATTEAWPLVAQLVRRGTFEYLASFVAHSQSETNDAGVTDTLTTLHTRRMFDAVLLKETERAGRFGHALALILFDVDQLTAINERHGYGVGSRILERIGILMRKYFRQHDWVARYGDDEIAVLLTAADADHAGELAERARAMVEDRLRFHRSRHGRDRAGDRERGGRQRARRRGSGDRSRAPLDRDGSGAGAREEFWAQPRRTSARLVDYPCSSS